MYWFARDLSKTAFDRTFLALNISTETIFCLIRSLHRKKEKKERKKRSNKKYPFQNQSSEKVPFKINCNAYG